MEQLPFWFLPGIVIRSLTRFGPPPVVRLFARSHRSLWTERPVFVFRVDDYPRWDVDSSEFSAFDDIFRTFDVPYVLGVIPWCESRDGIQKWAGDDETDYLRELVFDQRVELALHGFTHKPQSVRGYTTEIAAYSDKELSDRIITAQRWFADRKLPAPRAFIPPFNTFTRENFLVLKRAFKVVMAGPSSLSSFGKYTAQVSDGTVYLPSYRPLVGRAARISKDLDSVISQSQVNAITIHWAWERETGFRGVEDLLRHVKATADVWNLSQTVDLMRENGVQLLETRPVPDTRSH